MADYTITLTPPGPWRPQDARFLRTVSGDADNWLFSQGITRDTFKGRGALVGTTDALTFVIVNASSDPTQAMTISALRAHHDIMQAERDTRRAAEDAEEATIAAAIGQTRRGIAAIFAEIDSLPESDGCKAILKRVLGALYRGNAI